MCPGKIFIFIFLFLFSLIIYKYICTFNSPNTPGLRQWQKKQQLEKLLSALIEVKNNLDVDKKPPLLLKLAPDLTNVERKEIADVILTEKVNTCMFFLL